MKMKRFLIILSAILLMSYTSVNALVLREVEGAQVGGNATTTTDEELECQGILGDPANPDATAYWVQKALDILRYVAIIALIILSSIDFIKAVTQQDSDALKKAGQTFVKRLVYCVLIFLTPTIVNFLMKFIGAYSTCGI